MQRKQKAQALPNTASIQPLHPSSLVQPTPGPTTFYAVTIGKVPGVYRDVRQLDLLEVSTLSRFSMSCFTRWEDAAEYYRKEFEERRVYTTGSGNTQTSPINLDATALTPPAQKTQHSGIGMVRHNDSFSRMGTPTPQSGSAHSKALEALGFYKPDKPSNKPKPSGAATCVKKAPRGPDGKRLIKLKDVINVSTDDDDSDSLIVAVKKPAPSAGSSGTDSIPSKTLFRAPAPFPMSMAAPIQAGAPLLPAPSPFTMSVFTSAPIPTVPAPTAATDVVLSSAIAPAVPSLIPLHNGPNPEPVTPLPKRRFIKIYFENESDFDDPAVMRRILESACKTPVSPRLPSAASLVPRQATPGPSNNNAVTRATSVPLEAVPVSPSLSVASNNTEAELGYAPMDPNLLKDLEY